MTKLEYPYGYFCTYKAALCWESYRIGCKECSRDVLSTRKEKVKNRIKDTSESQPVMNTS
jgi:hypothetical protein